MRSRSSSLTRRFSVLGHVQQRQQRRRRAGGELLSQLAPQPLVTGLATVGDQALQRSGTGQQSLAGPQPFDRPGEHRLRAVAGHPRLVGDPGRELRLDVGVQGQAVLTLDLPGVFEFGLLPLGVLLHARGFLDTQLLGEIVDQLRRHLERVGQEHAQLADGHDLERSPAGCSPGAVPRSTAGPRRRDRRTVPAQRGTTPRTGRSRPHRSPRHEITYRAATLDVQPLAPDRADLFLNPRTAEGAVQSPETAMVLVEESARFFPAVPAWLGRRPAQSSCSRLPPDALSPRDQPAAPADAGLPDEGRVGPEVWPSSR